MRKVLILQSTVLLNSIDLETQTEKLQTIIDNGEVLVVPAWAEVVGSITDDGDGIEVIIKGVSK